MRGWHIFLAALKQAKPDRAVRQVIRQTPFYFTRLLIE